MYSEEKMKKMLKYAFLCVTVMFACVTIPSKAVSLYDALVIGIIASSVFVMFDIMFPAICIHKKK